MTAPRNLPPGQKAIPRLAVTGEREAAPFTPADWRLTVSGLVAQPLTLTLAELRAWPAVDRAWDTHCVTSWSHLGTRWRGVLLQSLLERVEPMPDARFVRFVAYSPRSHDTTLPLAYAAEHSLLAYECEGAPLAPEHGAPVRVVTEGKYFYKSLKWVKQVELLAEDQLGYWERVSAYHQNADPWRSQRFASRPMDPAELQRRLADRDFRGAVATKDPQLSRLAGVDLSHAHFEGAQLKGCLLQGLVLRHARLQGANFSGSTFRGSDLRNADLTGCDLEGASFVNADLRGADLRRTALSGTRFFSQCLGAKIADARFLCADIAREGVLDQERAYLFDPRNGAALL